MNDSDKLIKQLRDTPLFSEFTEDELRGALELLEREEAQPGTCIVRQDEPGSCMYLLVEGRAKVIHHEDGREVVLADLQPGEFFGEIALVDHGPRSADVEAVEKCVLYRIDHSSVSALAGVYPNAAFKFLIALGKKLVDRMRQSNRRYIDSMLFPLAGKN
jgi:CRP/FNR family transcriptional regulator, cyclic AMP receptor protein